MRRLTYSSLATAIGFGLLAFGFDLFSAQGHVCRIPILQPHISDVCGSLGLGDSPTQAERVAWEGREPGSCADLRVHIARFPDGAYRGTAADLLAARVVMQAETWTPGTRRLALFIRQGEAPTDDEASAQSAALSRAQFSAKRLCDGFVATTSFRLTSAKPAPQIWDCEKVIDGIVCGFDGEAVCELEERRVQESETCEGQHDAV